MRVCYIDESGCTGALPAANSPIQPVFAIAGVVFSQHRLSDLTHDFLTWKSKYFPGLVSTSPKKFDLLLTETKGADVRKNVISGRRRLRRHALGLLDHFVKLLETYDARIFGRVWIKDVGTPMNGTSVYTYSMQHICSTFQNFLLRCDEQGMVIADSRTKAQNALVSHSIFTQKFKAVGDEYDRIIEMPTFGHSENHVGLQVVDLLCSALLFPMATHAYCSGHIQSVHVQPGYKVLVDRYGQRLMRLQHRYQHPTSARMVGGLTVCDSLNKKPGHHLFGELSARPASPGFGQPQLSHPRPPDPFAS